MGGANGAVTRIDPVTRATGGTRSSTFRAEPAAPVRRVLTPRAAGQAQDPYRTVRPPETRLQPPRNLSGYGGTPGQNGRRGLTREAPTPVCTALSELLSRSAHSGGGEIRRHASSDEPALSGAGFQWSLLTAFLRQRWVGGQSGGWWPRFRRSAGRIWWRLTVVEDSADMAEASGGGFGGGFGGLEGRTPLSSKVSSSGMQK